MENLSQASTDVTLYQGQILSQFCHTLGAEVMGQLVHNFAANRSCNSEGLLVKPEPPDTSRWVDESILSHDMRDLYTGDCYSSPVAPSIGGEENSDPSAHQWNHCPSYTENYSPPPAGGDNDSCNPQWSNSPSYTENHSPLPTGVDENNVPCATHWSHSPSRLESHSPPQSGGEENSDTCAPHWHHSPSHSHSPQFQQQWPRSDYQMPVHQQQNHFTSLPGSFHGQYTSPNCVHARQPLTENRQVKQTSTPTTNYHTLFQCGQPPTSTTMKSTFHSPPGRAGCLSQRHVTSQQVNPNLKERVLKANRLHSSFKCSTPINRPNEAMTTVLPSPYLATSLTPTMSALTANSLGTIDQPCSFNDSGFASDYSSLSPTRSELSHTVQSGYISSSSSPVSPPTSPDFTDIPQKPLLSKKRPADDSPQDEPPTKKRGRHNEPLNNMAVDIMLAWYETHKSNPYPTNQEKQVMAAQGNITVAQVKSWFANKRNRNNNTRPKVQKKKMHEKLVKICHQLTGGNGLPMNSNTHIIHQLSSILSHARNQHC